MDFTDTKEEAEFRFKTKTWIQQNAPDYLKEHLETSLFGRVNTGPYDLLQEAKRWQQTKADAGWACIHWPAAFGGRDASAMQSVIWAQEEGLYSILAACFFIGQNMCAPTLMAFASQDQQSRFIPKIASGENIWCQLFSEPHGGSDLAGLRTRAIQEGDQWIVNGQKIWTSGAHYSDYGLLLTRTDPKVEKHKGLTMFFLDMKSPGVYVRPIKQADGQSGFNEVFFDDVRIDDSQRLGNVGQGWQVALTTLMNERAAIGGSIPTGYPELVQLLSKLNINNQPAMNNAVVRSKLADWHCKAEGLKNTSKRAISALSKGETPGPESSIGKLVAGNMMQDIAKFALELHGLSGVSPTHDPAIKAFQSILLRSPAVRIEGGTDQILLNIIAERVLGLPEGHRADKGIAFDQIPLSQ